MLTVRAAQLTALDDAQAGRHLDNLVAEIRERLPRHAAALGDIGLRDAVAAAVAQAQAHGLETVQAIGLFAHLQFVFGAGFDLEQPWARDVLLDAAPLDEQLRLQRLLAAAQAHVAGRIAVPRGAGVHHGT